MKNNAFSMLGLCAKTHKRVDARFHERPAWLPASLTGSRLVYSDRYSERFGWI
jgi:hypothetical protein